MVSPRIAVAYGSGTPTFAALKEASSGPDPAQHAANRPSTATAGTVRTPYFLALATTAGSCISKTSISHDEQAIRRTMATVSSHAAHPALKISIFRLALIVRPPTKTSVHPVPGYKVKPPS